MSFATTRIHGDGSSVTSRDVSKSSCEGEQNPGCVVERHRKRRLPHGYRPRVKKPSKIKLPKKNELTEELARCRKQFADFDSVYVHTLGYYFLSQFAGLHRRSDLLDFLDKVDTYRSLSTPTKDLAGDALESLRRIALVQTGLMDSKSNTSGCALPVDDVVKKLKAERLDREIFDECYSRVKEVLVSFHKPFLRSDQFVHFVQLLEYSKREMNPGDLRYVAPLGEGAFGRVIAVEKRDTRSIFAMKEIPKSVIRRTLSGSACVNEMRLLSRTKSPFVLNLKYSFHSAKAVHMVFELCMGGDLRQHLEKAGSFDPDRAIFYTAEILLGIDHIHSLEYCYRDLKPSNILLTGSGHCKISDLGLVIRLPKYPKILKHVAGTPGYWPPEIASRTATYFASDYWSLGVLLYVMLSGKKIADPLYNKRRKSKEKKESKHAFKQWSPFCKDPREQHVARKDPQMKRVNITVSYPSSIPPVARDFIEKMLVLNPKKRLGGTGGLREIQQHQLFTSLDWEKLARLEIEPPFRPTVREIKRRSHKSAGSNLGFKAVKDDQKEKEFYDRFVFKNNECFFEEVVDALNDEAAAVPAHGANACCTIS